MTAHRSRRWFQLSLKSLFLLTLLVATFFAGYSLALRQAEAERRRAELEAQRAIEEARLQVEAKALQAQQLQPPPFGLTWQVWPQQGQVWPQPQPALWPQPEQNWNILPPSKQ